MKRRSEPNSTLPARLGIAAFLLAAATTTAVWTLSRDARVGGESHPTEPGASDGRSRHVRDSAIARRGVHASDETRVADAGGGPDAPVLSAAVHSAVDGSQPGGDSLRDIAVERLLLWARERLGCGFLYDRDVLTGPDGEPLRVSYLPSKITIDAPPETVERETMIVLFECLRRHGLVAMSVNGFERPAYQILTAERAAGYGEVSFDIAALEGSYFGTLAIEVHMMKLDEAVKLVQRFMSDKGQMTAVPETSTILVSDFIDSLRAMAAAVAEAELPVERDDDTVSETFHAGDHDAGLLRAALEDSRAPGETFAVGEHEPTNSLLVTGRRREIAGVLARLTALTEAPAQARARIDLHVWRARSQEAKKSAQALAEYFAPDVSRGLVRVAADPSGRAVYVHCNARRYEDAARLLEQIDPMPLNHTEMREGIAAPPGR